MTRRRPSPGSCRRHHPRYPTQEWRLLADHCEAMAKHALREVSRAADGGPAGLARLLEAAHANLMAARVLREATSNGGDASRNRDSVDGQALRGSSPPSPSYCSTPRLTSPRSRTSRCCTGRRSGPPTPLERLNREVNRRTDAVGIFPHTSALLQLAACVLIEAHAEWQGSDRRYLSEGSMRLLTPPPPTVLDATKTPPTKTPRRRIATA